MHFYSILFITTGSSLNYFFLQFWRHTTKASKQTDLQINFPIYWHILLTSGDICTCIIVHVSNTIYYYSCAPIFFCCCCLNVYCRHIVHIDCNLYKCIIYADNCIMDSLWEVCPCANDVVHMVHKEGSVCVLHHG